LSEESVGSVVLVMHDLPAAEGCGVMAVQNAALSLAGAIGRGACRCLAGRVGGPVPRPMPWVAG